MAVAQVVVVAQAALEVAMAVLVALAATAASALVALVALVEMKKTPGINPKSFRH
jgi:hypothetical protein